MPGGLTVEEQLGGQGCFISFYPTVWAPLQSLSDVIFWTISEHLCSHNIFTGVGHFTPTWACIVHLWLLPLCSCHPEDFFCSDELNTDIWPKLSSCKSCQIDPVWYRILLRLHTVQNHSEFFSLPSDEISSDDVPCDLLTLYFSVPQNGSCDSMRPPIFGSFGIKLEKNFKLRSDHNWIGYHPGRTYLQIFPGCRFMPHWFKTAHSRKEWKVCLTT